MEIAYFDPNETLEREQLEEIQLAKLKDLLRQVMDSNPFYQRKLGAAGFKDAEGIRSLSDLSQLPFTIKEEFVADQAANPPFGTNLTFPLERYIKFHQTSGTTGTPLRWLDTDDSWDWWARCWAAVLCAAGVGPNDRIFFAFSFGPFIGFWSGFEGARKIGALALPGGGMDSRQRLYFLMENQASVLISTPSYALRLADVAKEEGLDLAKSGIQRTIHAGEPGACILATKRRIETLWGAKCFDHAGATEVGAFGFECAVQPGGVHLNEGEFIVEVIDPGTDSSADRGELVITNLGRAGMPVIRYRTGDLVHLDRVPCDCGRGFVRIQGGIIGRLDDMLIVRGVNIFPSSLENIVRGFAEIVEYRVKVIREREMDEMLIEIEVEGVSPDAIAQALINESKVRIGLRPQVTVVPPDTLPRFELKANRVFDCRGEEGH